MSETTPTKRNPFPGLRPFDQDDGDVFFGRQSDIDEMRQRLECVRFLAVVGPSGSGKSSVVRAGLLPALRDDGTGATWRIVTVQPGTGLMNRLAAAFIRVFPSGNILESESVRRDKLAAGLGEGAQALIDMLTNSGEAEAGRCLVVVDPFEELFYRGEPGENAAFMKMLLDVAHDDSVSVHVVVTLSSDFLGDCAGFKGLPDAVYQGLHLIAPLTQEQLREVIESPARVAGGRIPGEVVDRILRDVKEETEPLPTLQYVLRRIWDFGDSFGVPEYESLGGLAEAIPRDADRAIGELSYEERRVARKVFQCITYKVPGHGGVSWSVRLEEIAPVTGESESLVRQVVERLRASTSGFILPGSAAALTPDSLITISHDALIRKWDTLGIWVDEEDSAASIYRQLARSAGQHAEGREELWTGPALDFAAEKIKGKEWGPGWAKRLGGNYYAAINFFEESLREREAHGGRHEGTKSLGRTRVLAGILGVLFIGGLGLAFYTYQKRNEAVAQRQEAQRLLTEARQRNDAAMQGLRRAGLEKGEAELQRNAAIRQQEIAERQRQIAESQRRIAENQQRIAEGEGRFAEEREKSDRQLLYVANMNLADRAFREGDFVRGQGFLGEYLPDPDASGDDVRSFFWYYLWRENHDEVATLRGHANTVSTVAFSPDGKYLATGSLDGKVELWDPLKHQQLVSMPGNGSAVSAVGFSPDGKILGAVGRDGHVQLWDVGTRQELATVAEKGGHLLAMTFTPDGKSFVVGGTEGEVSLWDVETRTKLRSLEGHKRDVYAVAVSPDGKTLATGSQDDTVKLWKMSTGNEIATLEGKGDDVYAVAFSPDGRSLATGSKSGAVKLWDVASRRELATLAGRGGDVYSLTFSPNGKMLASGGRDGTVKLWDVATRKELNVLEGHGDAVVAAAFAPKGQLLATGSRDRTVKLWQAERKKAPAVLPGKTPVFAVAFEPGGKRLATASLADTVKLWDLTKGTEPVVLKGAGDVLFAVAFSPDGKTIATGSKDGTAKLWDVATGREREVLKGHGAVVFSVAFSPDGKTLATGSWDHTVKLWNVASGEDIATLEGHNDAVFSVAFSPDGKVLASGSKDTTVRLWDAATGKELATLSGHADAVFPVAFSPDGKILVTASRDGVVKLWDAESRAELATLKGHSDSISSVYFSPDGKVLATGSLDDTVKLWDLETRQELATLKGHTNDVYSVAFSPDGKLLATGSLDGTVRLWEGTTDTEVAKQR